MTHFATLVSTYVKGFAIIIEPFDEKTPTVINPILYFSCMDSSIAMSPIFDRFQSVVITSGTLSPMDMYPKILNFEPAIMSSFSMTLARKSLLPMVSGGGEHNFTFLGNHPTNDDGYIIRRLSPEATIKWPFRPDSSLVKTRP